jgi:hypothetical protein
LGKNEKIVKIQEKKMQKKPPSKKFEKTNLEEKKLLLTNSLNNSNLKLVNIPTSNLFLKN